MLQSLPKGLHRKFVNHFLSPTQIIDSLDIREGNRVLELGLPIGFFAPALLNKVGRLGRVYIAGPSQDSFGKLSHLAKRKNLKFSLLADLLIGDDNIPKDLDLIILTNLLSGTARPDNFCLSIGQYLKPDSEIVLIDWDNKDNVGPLMEQRVTKEDALRLMHSCGMKFKRILDLPGYHYGLVFSFKP